MSATSAVLWTVALWLFEHLCFELTEAIRPGAITDIVSVSACVVLATSVLVFAMMRVHSPDGSLRATLGLRWVGPIRLVLSAAAGAGLCPALATFDGLVAKRWPYDDPDALARLETLLDSSTHLALVLGVFVIIPLAREVFFRGILFGELRRGASAVASVVATSVLFAVFSLDWRSMPTALVLGLSLGWLRARSGSLVAPMAAHLAFWSVQGIPILRGVDPAADVSYPAKWIAAGLGLTLVALVVVGLMKRSEDGEERPAAPPPGP